MRQNLGQRKIIVCGHKDISSTHYYNPKTKYAIKLNKKVRNRTCLIWHMQYCKNAEFIFYKNKFKPEHIDNDSANLLLTHIDTVLTTKHYNHE